MKLLHSLVAIGLAAGVAAVPATAQTTRTTTTTVTRVHGPLKVLPHHNRKVCKVRWYHGRKTRKCWYR